MKKGKGFGKFFGYPDAYSGYRMVNSPYSKEPRFLSEKDREKFRILWNSPNGKRLKLELAKLTVRQANLSKIRSRILKFIQNKGLKLEDIRIVGIDRGGRLTSLMVKKALGLPEIDFVKFSDSVSYLSPNYAIIRRIANRGMWKGKYVLFVDSVVSGWKQKDGIERMLKTSIGKKLKMRGWALVAQSKKADLRMNWGRGIDHIEDLSETIGFEDTFPGKPRMKIVKTRKGDTPYDAIAIRKAIYKSDT